MVLEKICSGSKYCPVKKKKRRGGDLNSGALSSTGLANLLHTRLGYHDKQNAVALSNLIVFKIFRFLGGKGGKEAEGEEVKEYTETREQHGVRDVRYASLPWQKIPQRLNPGIRLAREAARPSPISIQS
jgi:hypothetical protein